MFLILLFPCVLLQSIKVLLRALLHYHNMVLQGITMTKVHDFRLVLRCKEILLYLQRRFDIFVHVPWFAGSHVLEICQKKQLLTLPSLDCRWILIRSRIRLALGKAIQVEHGAFTEVSVFSFQERGTE